MMKWLYVQDDPMLTVTITTVLVCLAKFLVEGVVIKAYGHTFNFGHADGGIYAAILAPVLGAHGYVAAKKPKPTGRVDNPDA